MSEVLQIERDGRVAILTLNRPEALNALSRALRAALVKALNELDGDEGIGAVVLTGAGDRAFTAGMDLKEASSGQPGEQMITTADDPSAAIDRFRKPIIVAVNGLCITGGMELMLACDVVIAASNARFADTHVRVGLMPGWGISQRLARQIGAHRAKEISLSGNFIDAQRAYELGVINRVTAPEDLLPTAIQLAADMADANQDVVRAYKKLIDEGLKLTLADGLKLERERAVAHVAGLKPGELEAHRVSASQRNRVQSA